MLERDELRHRIVAGRDLRAMSQSEMTRLVAQEGFKIHDGARLERGDPDIRLTDGRVRALAKVLRLPQCWFTEEVEELDQRLASLDLGSQPGEVTRLAQRVEELLERLDVAEVEQARADADEGSEPGQSATG